MGLSPEEQRALKEIEERFHESDPEFAERATYSAQRRKLQLQAGVWALGVLAGLVVLVLTYSRMPLIAVIAFCAMVGCAFMIFTLVRRLGAIALGDFVDGAKKMADEQVANLRKRLEEEQRKRDGGW